MIFSIILIGLSMGCIYGCLAMSLCYIHRISGVINFSHCEFATLLTLVLYGLTHYFSPSLGYLLAIAFALCSGFLVYYIFIGTVRSVVGIHKPFLEMIMTIALFSVFNGLGTAIFGKEIRKFNSIFGEDAVMLGSSSIAMNNLGLIAVSLLLGIVLYFLIEKSQIGLNLRAIADNRQEAELSGLNLKKNLAIAWSINAVVGLINGVLVAPQLYLYPNMLMPLLVNVLAVAVISGLQVPISCVFIGMAIGLIENLCIFIFDIGQDQIPAVTFALAVTILIFKPKGLFSRPDFREV